MVFPAVVSSECCLECRGCCLFQLANSDWQPRLTVEEEIVLDTRHAGCSTAGKLKTAPSGEKHACCFLNTTDHHCRIYQNRPSECALYPFLLSHSPQGMELMAHLACPFVAQQRNTPAWDGLVERVVGSLQSDRGKKYLKEAGAVSPDYSRFGAEVERVARIPYEDTGYWLLQRRDMLEKALRARPVNLSSRSFAGLFAWADFFEVEIFETDGNWCVMAGKDGASFLYFPPLGEVLSSKAVETAFERMGRGPASRIEGISAPELPLLQQVGYQAQLQTQEYIYDRGLTAGLPGSAYESKRSDLHHFLRRHQPVFRALEPRDLEGCGALFERWLDNRRAAYKDGIYRAMLVENRVVHGRLLGQASSLALTGRVVESAGCIVGYTVGFPLNETMFCVALEVTEPRIKGLPVFIFRELADDVALKKYSFINAMDDFGLPAVAAAKRSWRPVRKEPVYSLCSMP